MTTVSDPQESVNVTEVEVQRDGIEHWIDDIRAELSNDPPGWLGGLGPADDLSPAAAPVIPAALDGFGLVGDVSASWDGFTPVGDVPVVPDAFQPSGEVPAVPEPVGPVGDVPVAPVGDAPVVPDGFVPVVPDGDVPVVPDGFVPVVPDGDVPVVPDGFVPDGFVPVAPVGPVGDAAVMTAVPNGADWEVEEPFVRNVAAFTDDVVRETQPTVRIVGRHRA